MPTFKEHDPNGRSQKIMNSKRRRQFDVELDGPNVSPETVDVRELCAIISQLETALREAVSIDDRVSQSEPLLSLVNVSRGSDRLTFVPSPAGFAALIVVVAAVASADFSEVPRKVHEACAALSKKVVANNWTLTITGPKIGTKQPIVISKARPVPELPAADLAEGTTTVYGTLMRVGGEPPRAILKPAQGDQITIKVTQDQAKELGRRLYEEVGLHGDAAWNGDSRQLESFTVRRVLAYEKTDILAAFQELAEAAEGRWDGIDAAKFVKNLRSERSK